MNYKRLAGYEHFHGTLEYTFVHRTNVTNMFVWLISFLCLTSLPHFFIDANVGRNFAICVSENTITIPSNLKSLYFLCSQWHHIHVKFGNYVNQA